MKVWIYSIIGLIIFCAVGVGIQFYIGKSAAQLDRDLQSVQTALHQKEWRITGNTLSEVHSKWKKTKPLWAILIRHLEIDAIDQALVRTEKAVESESYPESLMELGSLNQLIKHVPEREKLNVVNIF